MISEDQVFASYEEFVRLRRPRWPKTLTREQVRQAIAALDNPTAADAINRLVIITDTMNLGLMKTQVAR